MSLAPALLTRHTAAQLMGSLAGWQTGSQPVCQCTWVNEWANGQGICSCKVNASAVCLCASTASRALSLPAIRFEVFRLSQADSPVTTAASSFPESLEGFLHRLTLPENPHLISASQTDVTSSLFSLRFYFIIPLYRSQSEAENILLLVFKGLFLPLNHSNSSYKWEWSNLLLLYYIFYSIMLENLLLSHKNAAF